MIDELTRVVRWAAAALLVPLVAGAALAGDEPPPQPAVYPAPKAVKSLLLDVAYTGHRYVAVGNNGVILVSGEDNTWDQVRVPVSVMLTRVVFADERYGWVVGHDRVILRTDDGGLSWSLQYRDVASGKAFYDLHAFSARRAIAIGGDSRLLRTDDGGESWTPAGDGPLFEMGWNFNGIDRLNDGCLMVAGERGLLMRSCDDGATWVQVRSPYIGSFYGVLPYGPHGAAVYGMRGHVYVADDVRSLEVVDSAGWDPYMNHTVTDPAALAAIGWREVATPMSQSLYGGVVNGAGCAVIAGVGGGIVAGDLSGDRLQLVPNRNSSPISALHIQEKALLTVGRAGIGHVAHVPVSRACLPPSG